VLHILGPVVEKPRLTQIELPFNAAPGFAVKLDAPGPPFLHNYLPFWVAVLVGKLIILLIPILGVLYPMVKFLPGLYDWLMRSKILRMYGELRFLEDEMADARGVGPDEHGIIARLDRLEDKQTISNCRSPMRACYTAYEIISTSCATA